MEQQQDEEPLMEGFHTPLHEEDNIVIKDYNLSYRPQQRFASTIDNSFEPFVPKIRYKPNAVTPLFGNYFLPFSLSLFLFLLLYSFIACRATVF